MVLDCWLNCSDDIGFWRRKVTFPFAPFPGLKVGGHTVRAVYVCQGDLDGKGSAEVEFEPEPKAMDGILAGQGWTFDS